MLINVLKADSCQKMDAKKSCRSLSRGQKLAMLGKEKVLKSGLALERRQKIEAANMTSPGETKRPILANEPFALRNITNIFPVSTEIIDIKEGDVPVMIPADMSMHTVDVSELEAFEAVKTLDAFCPTDTDIIVREDKPVSVQMARPTTVPKNVSNGQTVHRCTKFVSNGNRVATEGDKQINVQDDTVTANSRPNPDQVSFRTIADTTSEHNSLHFDSTTETISEETDTEATNDFIPKELIVEKRTGFTQEQLNVNKDYENAIENEQSVSNGDKDTNDSMENLNMEASQKRQGGANWTKNLSKKLRLQGKAYLGLKYDKENCVYKYNNVRPEKKIGPRCSSNKCKLSQVRQCNMIPEAEREGLFKRFWSEMDWGQRKVYISSLIDVCNTKQTTVAGISRRNFSYSYHLKTSNGNRLQVCRQLFLDTFLISSFTIRNWIADANEFHGIPPTPKQKQSVRSTKRELAATFLRLLPKLPSHYCRASSSKLYLEPELNSPALLYRLFKEYIAAQDNSESVSRSILMEAFKAQNLGFLGQRKINVTHVYHTNLATSMMLNTKNIEKEKIEPGWKSQMISVKQKLNRVKWYLPWTCSRYYLHQK